MKVPAVKGTRDFYPDQMAIRTWIFETWRAASRRAGFQEYDGPIFENLTLFTEKSGDEIVGQLYKLEDYGGRELAIRPEMTPTLARMIAARQQSLPRPIKWFSINRLCRYERPQRGRLREFFQWNIDVVGIDRVTADAEVTSVAVDALVDMGLTAEDIEVRVNSRRMLAALLRGSGVPEECLKPVYAVADKRDKIPDEALQAMFEKLPLPPDVRQAMLDLMGCDDLDEVARFIQDKGVAEAADALAELRELLALLDAFGKGAFCRFDIGVVRGLAYYTGPVFEIFDRRGELRAICGGGRYDNLLGAMGGQEMPAVGFGMGDVVLGELLSRRGLLPKRTHRLDYYVVPVGEAMLPAAVEVAAALRRGGCSAEFGLRVQAVGKQLRRANELGAGRAVIIGPDEWNAGDVQVRDMASVEQHRVSVAALLEQAGS